MDQLPLPGQLVRSGLLSRSLSWGVVAVRMLIAIARIVSAMSRTHNVVSDVSESKVPAGKLASSFFSKYLFVHTV